MSGRKTGSAGDAHQSTPIGEALRLFAQAGVNTAARIDQLRRVLLISPEEVQQKIAARLGRELLNENGFPFSPEAQQEIADAIFNPDAPIVPALYRAFVGYTRLLDGDLFKTSDVRVLTSLHWSSRWVTSGLPVFALTHGLAAALLLTEPPPYDPVEFALPAPAFAITLPTGLIPFLDGDKKTWAESILVHRMLSTDDEGKTADVVQIEIRSRERGLWHRKPVGELFSVEREQAVFGDYDLVEDDFRTIEVALRLVRNLVAWVGAYGRGEPEGRKFHAHERGYRRDRDGAPIPTMWLLGREVKIAPELRRLAAEVALGEKHGGPGWKLRMQHCVAGHWKWQPCGPGRSERKHIHVEVYWRGPKGAAAWSHVYTGGEK